MKPSWPVFGLAGILSCTIPISANAEDGEPVLIELGARFSMGGTTLRASDDDRMVGVEARKRAGYSLGAYATWWRLGWLRLQTEFLYSAKNVTLAETAGDMTAGYSLEYLELPILARLDIPLRSRVEPFAAFGGSPAVLIDAEHSAGFDPSDLLHRLDFGLVGALGARIALYRSWELTLEARGVYGLTDVFTRTSRKNRAVFLSIAIGYSRVPRPVGSQDDHRETEDSPAVEVVDQGIIGLRFLLDDPRAPLVAGADTAVPVLVGGTGETVVLTGGKHIGYIYRVEGYLHGQKVVYIGSAADIKRRLTKDNHKWKKLLKQKNTTVHAKKVYGKLDIGATRRGTLESARRQALRSMEEPELQKAKRQVEGENQSRKPGQKGAKVLNKSRAAKKPKLWQRRHQTTRDPRWEKLKAPGSSIKFRAVGGGLLLLDAYRMYRDEKMSRYAMAPYVLEDDHGAFTLSYEKGILGGLFSTTYYKRYVSGDYKGKKIELSDSEFDILKEEAEALWGTVDWKGDFVPGLLQPELPVVTPNVIEARADGP